MYSESGSPSLRNRIKSSMSCFRTFSSHNKLTAPDCEYDHGMAKQQPRSPRWGCLFSKIGNKHRRRPNSTYFSYDPLSYSLNFEDDADELRANFSSRVPVSPSRGDRPREPAIIAAVA